MDKILAQDIAKETEKLSDSFSQVMNLAIQLKEESEGKQRLLDRRAKEITKLKRQRDEVLGKSPLLEKSQAEANEVEAKDLKPALILALVQRDVAMRSVRKIHKISELINTWDGNTQENWNNGPSAFDIVRHIKDVILIKEDV